MPAPGKELSTVDFGSMIGGPLVAVINAQSQAASATLNFIKTVGFDGDRAASIPFQYKKVVHRADGTVAEQSFQLSVPILSLLPVPFVRIQEANIEFRAKVMGVFVPEEEAPEDETSETRGPQQPSGNPAMLRVAFSHRNRSGLGGDSSKSYSMNVKIRAVQDEIPAGLERLLATLESHIQEQSPSMPTP